jgi:hypothetical protein
VPAAIAKMAYAPGDAIRKKVQLTSLAISFEQAVHMDECMHVTFAAIKYLNTWGGIVTSGYFHR